MSSPNFESDSKRLWAGPGGRVSLLLVAAVVLSGCGINQIPTLDESAKAAWSDVLNQYQRRADLIPNLVETLKGFAEQESKVLTEVIEARAKATQVQVPADILTNKEAFDNFQNAQNNLSGALGRLLVVVERYPGLKIEPELSRTSVAARRDQKQDRRRAARLHRSGAGLQHRATHHSRTLAAGAALCRRGADAELLRLRREDGNAEGRVLAKTSASPDNRARYGKEIVRFCDVARLGFSACRLVQSLI